jgi:hypothetical protein
MINSIDAETEKRDLTQMSLLVPNRDLQGNPREA